MMNILGILWFYLSYVLSSKTIDGSTPENINSFKFITKAQKNLVSFLADSNEIFQIIYNLKAKHGFVKVEEIKKTIIMDSIRGERNILEAIENFERTIMFIFKHDLKKNEKNDQMIIENLKTVLKKYLEDLKNHYYNIINVLWYDAGFSLYESVSTLLKYDYDIFLIETRLFAAFYLDHCVISDIHLLYMKQNLDSSHPNLKNIINELYRISLTQNDDKFHKYKQYNQLLLNKLYDNQISTVLSAKTEEILVIDECFKRYIKDLGAAKKSPRKIWEINISLKEYAFNLILIIQDFMIISNYHKLYNFNDESNKFTFRKKESILSPECFLLLIDVLANADFWKIKDFTDLNINKYETSGQIITNRLFQILEIFCAQEKEFIDDDDKLLNVLTTDQMCILEIYCDIEKIYKLVSILKDYILENSQLKETDNNFSSGIIIYTEKIQEIYSRIFEKYKSMHQDKVIHLQNENSNVMNFEIDGFDKFTNFSSEFTDNLDLLNEIKVNQENHKFLIEKLQNLNDIFINIHEEILNSEFIDEKDFKKDFENLNGGRNKKFENHTDIEHDCKNNSPFKSKINSTGTEKQKENGPSSCQLENENVFDHQNLDSGIKDESLGSFTSPYSSSQNGKEILSKNNDNSLKEATIEEFYLEYFPDYTYDLQDEKNFPNFKTIKPFIFKLEDSDEDENLSSFSTNNSLSYIVKKIGLHNPEKTQADYLDLLNDRYNSNTVPNMWNKYRCLNKTKNSNEKQNKCYDYTKLNKKDLNDKLFDEKSYLKICYKNEIEIIDGHSLTSSDYIDIINDVKPENGFKIVIRDQFFNESQYSINENGTTNMISNEDENLYGTPATINRELNNNENHGVGLICSNSNSADIENKNDDLSHEQEHYEIEYIAVEKIDLKQISKLSVRDNEIDAINNQNFIPYQEKYEMFNKNKNNNELQKLIIKKDQKNKELWILGVVLCIIAAVLGFIIYRKYPK